ncbi:MAG: dual specificity protein phosphatase family protein [Chlamydiia bacterium]|nr:dual specificity protein phosphatase family protein [Chlamydiia bacterium]
MNQGHFEELQRLGMTHVISVLEDFEMEVGYFNTPVSHANWNQKGITTTQISAPDFYGLSAENIRLGVNDLRLALSRGEVVYIHCKAGRGRSASIVVAYLMEDHGYSLEQAISFVKQYRPDINLNEEQQQAIKNYFSDEAPHEVALANRLDHLLYYVIHGFDHSSVDAKVPEMFQGWLPKVDIQSTEMRRNRYLREWRGNQDEAVKAAIDRNHGMARSLKTHAASALPVVGDPLHYSLTLWYQLREIALIAALYGHNIEDPIVQKQILLCLVGGNLQKAPAEAIDILARKIAAEIVKRAVSSTISAGVPTHLIYNYLTNNSAKVSTHAIETFGGANACPIPQESYS